MSKRPQLPPRPPWTPFEEIVSRDGARRYQNSRYIVAVYEEHPLFLHLSIKHRLPGVYNYLQDWRDYQRIKNALTGLEAEGMQLYPAESRLVDAANQFHLWVLKQGDIPLGFRERLVSEGDAGIGVQQRPFEDANRPDDLTQVIFVRPPLGNKPKRS